MSLPLETIKTNIEFVNTVLKELMANRPTHEGVVTFLNSLYEYFSPLEIKEDKESLSTKLDIINERYIPTIRLTEQEREQVKEAIKFIKEQLFVVEDKEVVKTV